MTIDPVVEQAMLGVITLANPVNRLIQAEDKAAAINALETLLRGGYGLNADELRVWWLAQGRPADEAARLAEYVTGVIGGKRYRIEGRWNRKTADEAARLAQYVTGVIGGKRYRIEGRWNRKTGDEILSRWRTGAEDRSV